MSNHESTKDLARRIWGRHPAHLGLDADEGARRAVEVAEAQR
jgi:hypothetical protein